MDWIEGTACNQFRCPLFIHMAVAAERIFGQNLGEEINKAGNNCWRNIHCMGNGIDKKRPLEGHRNRLLSIVISHPFRCLQDALLD